MSRLLASFLVLLVLLQTLGLEVLVVNYELNKARITELYCVNKARPLLHCNGQCHLARQLRKADGGDKKAPAEASARVKYEVLPPAALALALCGAVPGSAVPGVMVQSDQYLLAPNPSDPIVMVVQVISPAGCSVLDWPICPPGPHWAGPAAQHVAAAAFIDSLSR